MLGKPALRIDYGTPATEYAADITRELRKAGFKVTLSKQASEPVTLFCGYGVGANNLVEIHQTITDAWPYISPFIPIIYEIIKGLVRKKRGKGDKTRTRVKLDARDNVVVDFNDQQIEKREHQPEGPPMIIPDVSEIVPVPDDAKPASKGARKKPKPKKSGKKAARTK